MNFFEKKHIWTVDSEISAAVFKGILEEEEIPYEFFLSGDDILGNFQNLEKGYGYFQVPKDWETAMNQLFSDFQKEGKGAQDA
ncbi:MAG: hypothetical protein A2Z96_00355 [Spirochaetes bacterium GWB1_48_6]|nr:MAG: hypothetical protein A2Z96_00355 [Spirochaetes bacterium GWB1_48_6]